MNNDVTYDFSPQNSSILVSTIWDVICGFPQNVRIGFYLSIIDWKLEHRGKFFGFLWAFLSPLAYSVAFFSVKNSENIQIAGRSINSAIFLLIGFSLYQVWLEGLMAQLGSIRKNKDLVSKLRIPIDVLIYASIFRSAFSLIIRLFLIFSGFLFFKISPSENLLFFFLFALFIVFNSAAIGVAIMPIATLFGDVQQAISSISIGLIFISTVLTPPVEDRGSIFSKIEFINPLSSILDTARSCLLGYDALLSGPAYTWGIVSLGILFFNVIMVRLIMPVLIERLGN